MYFSYFQVDVLEKRHFCLFSESKIQENDACLCYLYYETHLSYRITQVICFTITLLVRPISYTKCKYKATI